MFVADSGKTVCDRKFLGTQEKPEGVGGGVRLTHLMSLWDPSDGNVKSTLLQTLSICHFGNGSAGLTVSYVYGV